MVRILLGRLLGALLGGLLGAVAAALVAALGCGTLSYAIEPHPEMVHPFFFPASLGAVTFGPVGFLAGAAYGAIRWRRLLSEPGARD
jgi:hypothetical protein